jgi:RNA-directed DNA polymerase
MSKLAGLKAARSLPDFAKLLGFKPSAFSYILYVLSDAKKYTQFDIPKRRGGVRRISAPTDRLKKLQSRLSSLLQDCMDELDGRRTSQKTVVHGFRRHHSIVSNAARHRNRNYVLNIDLKDFFGSIHFGRVRGYFIKNRDFALEPTIATMLAKIACHDNSLPQGSPCSPVISNLVARILDIRLAKLASRYKCRYTRYADDLTFSTNLPSFPEVLAVQVEGPAHVWTVGANLRRVIEGTGFSINDAKTRVQYRTNRQEVTGLVANKVVNAPIAYRRAVRARVHSLLTTGAYYVDPDEASKKEADASPERLRGALSFLDGIFSYRNKKSVEAGLGPLREPSLRKLYRQFLFFTHFYNNDLPLILCEGKTDRVYIRSAIRRLARKYSGLARVARGGAVTLKVKLFRYTDVTSELLRLSGGSGEMKGLVLQYQSLCAAIRYIGLTRPVVLLVDNDSGAKDLFNVLRNFGAGAVVDGTKPFYFAGSNLYVVPTPIAKAGDQSVIEDCFDKKALSVKLGGKKFSRDARFDSAKSYGKNHFAEYVVKPREETINFSGFEPILDRISAVILAHAKRMGRR